MTQEEILYNKRCAKFLGWHNAGMKDLELWKSSENSIGVQTSELKFHSDWNWIMEVKTAICNYSKVDEFNTQYDSVAKGYTCSIFPAYKNTFDAFYTDILSTEKEAVVQAIDQFLIWYNE